MKEIKVFLSLQNMSGRLPFRRKLLWAVGARPQAAAHVAQSPLASTSARDAVAEREPKRTSMQRTWPAACRTTSLYNIMIGHKLIILNLFSINLHLQNILPQATSPGPFLLPQSSNSGLHTGVLLLVGPNVAWASSGDEPRRNRAPC